MPDRHVPAVPCDCPGAPETAGPDGYGLGPLDSADAAFRALVTGPRPLALNPARLAPGCPTGTSRWTSSRPCCCTRPPGGKRVTRCGPSWSAAPAPTGRRG